MLESQLQDKSLALLKSRGFVGFKVTQGAYATPGIFDWIGTSPIGIFTAIEFKKPGKYERPEDGLTPAQRKWYEKWRVIPNAIVLVIDDYDELVRELERCGY